MIPTPRTLASLLLLLLPGMLHAANDTVVSGAQVLVSSCTQLTVTARYAGDDNRDGSTMIEYNTSDTWPGTVACREITDSLPRPCLIPQLEANSSYWVRVSFSDPDGVTGPNPEVLGPFSTGSCATDTVAPAAPVIESPTAGERVGDPRPILAGTAEADAWVTASVDDQYACAAAADGASSAAVRQRADRKLSPAFRSRSMSSRFSGSRNQS